MVALKRTAESTRTFKIYLKSKLEVDSNGVDHNLLGTVIRRNFVYHVEHVYKTDTHILTLAPDTYVGGEVIVAQNSGEECIRLFKVRPYESMLLPIKHIEKVELMESKKVTLAP